MIIHLRYREGERGLPEDMDGPSYPVFPSPIVKLFRYVEDD